MAYLIDDVSELRRYAHFGNVHRNTDCVNAAHEILLLFQEFCEQHERGVIANEPFRIANAGHIDQRYNMRKPEANSFSARQ